MPVLLLPAAKLGVDGTGIAFNVDGGLVENGGRGETGEGDDRGPAPGDFGDNEVAVSRELV